jgi:hypothetical protein
MPTDVLGSVRKVLHDRRTTSRYPIAQDLQYRVLDNSDELAWNPGQVLDISSRGVRFTTANSIHTGVGVQLSIEWPVALGGECPLQLVVLARVVRTTGREAAAVIEKYEFRTRRRQAMAAR